MRKVFKRLFVLTLCAALTLSTSFGVLAEDIGSAKDELSSLEKQKKEMEKKIASLEKEKGNIQTYIEKLDKQMEELDTQITTLNGEIEQTSSLLEQTRQELADAKVTQQEQYDIMKARVKYMFENGGDDYFTMLLEASSLEDFLNQAEYVSQISKYDQGLYTRYDETRQGIETKEAEISANLDKLNTLQGELQIQKDGLDELTANKEKELKQYEKNIEVSEQAVEEYNQAIDEQEQKIQQLIIEEQKRQEAIRKKQEEEARRKQEEEERRKREEEQQNNGQATGSDQDNSNNTVDDIVVSSGPVSLRWPLNITGKITSRFVDRINPVTGRHESHRGLDIAAAKGTPIVAAASGTVLVATYSPVMGNYVIVSHSANFYTIYMHSSALKVSSGDTVTQGQTIALVGTTGQSTGNHLHFGVCLNGSYVNPENYVKQP